MIRTQIYLDEELHRELILLAQSKKTSMAEVTREVLKKGLKNKSIDNSGMSTMLALSRMKIHGGPKDLSYNLDHYLYGGPKKRKKKA